MQRKYGKREMENAVLASTVTNEKVVAKASHDKDGDTIVLGIGFGHKSGVKISASLRANGKFKIKDKINKCACVVPVTCGVSRVAAESLVSISEGGDDDSLDGIDEDLFTGTDEFTSVCHATCLLLPVTALCAGQHQEVHARLRGGRLRCGRVCRRRRARGPGELRLRR